MIHYGYEVNRFILICGSTRADLPKSGSLHPGALGATLLGKELYEKSSPRTSLWKPSPGFWEI